MTARELGLDLNQREHVARDVVAQLQTRDLVVTRYNGHATLARLTDRGRDAVATMRAQHVARAERQSIISAADPASVVTCPTCRGARRFCETCLGLRVVIAEQQS